MEHIVRVHKDGKVIGKKVKAGTSLLSFLRKYSLDISAPCGGNGTCGKCRVRVSGLAEEPSSREKSKLGSKAQEKGFRLACYNKIDSDIDVFIGEENKEAKIALSGKERKIKLDPIIIKQYFALNPPSIGDQRSDVERAMSFPRKLKALDSLDLIRKLPDAMRGENFKVTAVCAGKKLLAVESGDTTGKLFGIAVDLGTTTIAAYLVNLITGERTDRYSLLNSQAKFGADVVSRIKYTLDSQMLVDEMNELVVGSINQAVEYFVTNNKLNHNDIYAASFVGNTTMLHFLLKLSAKNMTYSPFIPVTTEMYKLKAGDLGININPCGQAVVFPSVSAYIGGDTVGAVLSSGMYRMESVTLLIDIGTNGEIVLGNSNWMYSCSTAAGPAFEGAQIRNGVGGVSGAIDKVDLSQGVKYSTIGNARAIGICGSGIIDAAAQMLSKGVINSSGRVSLGEEDVNSLPEELKNSLVEIDGAGAFLLSKSSECGSDTDIAITQKDIRELQNAKAAIAAGIKILVKKAGIYMENIDRVLLAGGFGSFMNVDSALGIGLIPLVLKGKIEAIGNAAGEGAVEGLLSKKMLKKAEKIKGMVKYIELSACADFEDEYINCMSFEA